MVSVTRSLREAARWASEVRTLDLATSDELQCVNLMCENVGERCACKLALWLSRHPLPNLEVLDLSRNHLRFLPEPVFRLLQLRTLDVSHNKLTEIPAAAACLIHLEEINVSGNFDITDLPTELLSLPSLRTITVFDAESHVEMQAHASALARRVEPELYGWQQHPGQWRR